MAEQGGSSSKCRKVLDEYLTTGGLRKKTPCRSYFRVCRRLVSRVRSKKIEFKFLYEKIM